MTKTGEPGVAFVQYKGTDICMDFWCECGTHGHTEKKFGTLKFDNETMSFTCNGDKIYEHTKVTRV